MNRTNVLWRLRAPGWTQTKDFFLPGGEGELLWGSSTGTQQTHLGAPPRPLPEEDSWPRCAGQVSQLFPVNAAFHRTFSSHQKMLFCLFLGSWEADPFVPD